MRKVYEMCHIELLIETVNYVFYTLNVWYMKKLCDLETSTLLIKYSYLFNCEKLFILILTNIWSKYVKNIHHHLKHKYHCLL